MFPNELDSHRIELSVNVVSTYKGQTVEDLQEQNLGAYNIYRRYAKEADEQGSEPTMTPNEPWKQPQADEGNGNSRTIK